MMDENFFNGAGEEQDLLNRFDKMMRGGGSYFFDSEEFEIIIDYYLDFMNLENAHKAIQMAMRQYPNSTCFLLKKARYFAIAGKLEKALTLLQQTTFFEPDNPEYFMVYGQILSQQGKSKEAIEQFEKAFKHEEFEEMAIANIAGEYELLGDYTHAIEWIKKAIYLNPDNEFALNDLSFCYEMSKKQEEAILFFTDFLDEYPFSSIAWFNLGSAYFTMELYEKAIDAYDYAVSINIDFASAYFNKGNALNSLGRYDEAISAYLETLALEPPEALTYYYLAECYERKEDYYTALDYYKKSLELDTLNPEAFIGIAVCLSELSHEIAALDFVEKALNIVPEEIDYLRMKAHLHQKLGQMDKAFETYKKITIFDKTNFEVWLDYSNAWMEAGDFENGLDILWSGIVFHPENAVLKYRMAACLAKAGKMQEAAVMFEKALRIDPHTYQSAFDYYPPMKDISLFINMLDMD